MRTSFPLKPTASVIRSSTAADAFELVPVKKSTSRSPSLPFGSPTKCDAIVPSYAAALAAVRSSVVRFANARSIIRRAYTEAGRPSDRAAASNAESVSVRRQIASLPFRTFGRRAIRASILSFDANDGTTSARPQRT
jgi:hypothetical protein